MCLNFVNAVKKDRSIHLVLHTREIETLSSFQEIQNKTPILQISPAPSLPLSQSNVVDCSLRSITVILCLKRQVDHTCSELGDGMCLLTDQLHQCTINQGVDPTFHIPLDESFTKLDLVAHSENHLIEQLLQASMHVISLFSSLSSLSSPHFFFVATMSYYNI